MQHAGVASQLPFGWVCFSNDRSRLRSIERSMASQLPFGWVCFSNFASGLEKCDRPFRRLNCLSAGSVSLTPVSPGSQPGWIVSRLNCLSAGSVSLTDIYRRRRDLRSCHVSIAFRLGLFL